MRTTVAEVETARVAAIEALIGLGWTESADVLRGETYWARVQAMAGQVRPSCGWHAHNDAERVTMAARVAASNTVQAFSDALRRAEPWYGGEGGAICG